MICHYQELTPLRVGEHHADNPRPPRRSEDAGSRLSGGETLGTALAVAETVVELLPGDLYGWIQRSFALHELKRTAEAREKLKPAAKKFPKQHLVFYNLACYACQLGERKEALKLLGKAIDLAGKNDIRLKALEDPDLEPLWKDIGEI